MHDLDIPRMMGWAETLEESRAAVRDGRMLHLSAETSNICNFDCEYCYTVELTATGDEGHAHHLPGELSIGERLDLIARAAELGARSYDVVGAGEPLIDPHCMTQLGLARSFGMQIILFTNGWVLGGPKGEELVRELSVLNATVVVKHHGETQVHDRVVRRTHAAERRDIAIERLIAAGFNASSPTRLGIDTIVYEATVEDIPRWVRWARERNIYAVCSSFIPAGRTKGTERAVSFERMQEVLKEVARIDRDEFGLSHSAGLPFVGSGTVCTQTVGLYVNIRGEVYDCVAKETLRGNVRDTPLRDLWLAHIERLQSFNGGCAPRDRVYRKET